MNRPLAAALTAGLDLCHNGPVLSREEQFDLFGASGRFISFENNRAEERQIDHKVVELGKDWLANPYSNRHPKHESLVGDVVAISKFLSNGFSEPLARRLGDLEHRLRSKTFQNRATGESRLEPHALRETLIESLPPGFDFELRGSDGAGRRPLVLPGGLLTSDEFFGVISLGRHLKDPLIGLEHGEYTHLIQWFLIHGGVHLENELIEVYRFLASIWARSLPFTESGTARNVPLWVMAFDRPSPVLRPANEFVIRGTDHRDFRCPDMLNLSLSGIPALSRSSMDALDPARDLSRLLDGAFVRASKDWPSLTTFMNRRIAKRSRLWTRVASTRAELIKSIQDKAPENVRALIGRDYFRASFIYLASKEDPSVLQTDTRISAVIAALQQRNRLDALLNAAARSLHDESFGPQ